MEEMFIIANSSCIDDRFYKTVKDIITKNNASFDDVCSTYSRVLKNWKMALSEESIDALIPSCPSSPRSVSEFIGPSKCENIEYAVNILQDDDDFLLAAETGDEVLLRKLISQGVHIHQKDHLERNALHFAVCSGNRRAVQVLLSAGVNPRLKDQVGMTPLSLCLMRRPSWKIAIMLFDYGAQILPRTYSMDTGLFLQFVMMCEPTREEKRILHLLTEKGALVNDPHAPGGRQPLHFAAMSNNCHLINILLELGADVFLTNHRHQTPKQVAATFKCKDAFKLLNEFEESCNNLVC